MANLIQIKRSLNTGTTPTLANGELAYTANGDVLFIGSNGVTVSIGGKRTPGVLTANQALVANSTGFIDTVKAANLVFTSLSANGSYGSNGQVLVTNGTAVFWGTGTSGSNTQVQFNDSGVANATAGFTFNKTSNTLAIGNTVTTTFVLATDTVNSAVLSVGTSFKTNTTQVTIGSSVGLSANGSLGSANQVLRTSGSGVYWADDVGDISAITAGDGLTGGGSTGEVTLSVGAGNGISVAADAVSVAGGTTLTVNSTGAHVNSTLSITSLTTSGDVTVNGNTKLGDSSSDVVSFTAAVNTSIMPTTNVTYNLGNNTIRWNEIHASNVHSVVGYFDGNVEVGGDLIVVGNVTTTNVQSVVVSDPMIYLAGNNYSSDLVDIGFAANYYDGATQRHTGFFRDATDGTWKLFANSTQELSGNNVVNTSAVGYTTAFLETYLLSGGLVSNATHVALTANSTVNVAIVGNSITLSTPLAATSGGTGFNTYTSGDILVANTGNALSKLALGTDGYVLQSNGTAVVYGTLDGGTY